MSRFNKQSVPRVGPKSAIRSITNPYTGETIQVDTYEGGKGFVRDAKSELFQLAVSFMGGDDNFYEKSDERYERLISLLGQHSVYSDMKWLYNFVNWLRNDAQMRTVSMVIAVEAARYRVLAEVTDKIELLYGTGVWVGNRDLVSVACSRADEPAEVLAYWLVKYGKMIPQYIKNGVADAATRLYTERSYLKYGKGASASVSMKDVLRLTHAKPKADWQNHLFEWITHENEVIVHNLPMIHTRKELYKLSEDARRYYLTDPANVEGLNAAGMTWETLSEWYPDGMNATAWEAVIPSMGYMAILRNLRNFDQAGISRSSVEYVCNKLSDPEEVAKSRQLPYRFYSAYRSLDSVRYASALDSALTDSLNNIPVLAGRTLVLVDRSGSMDYSKASSKSNITYADIASLFGAAWTQSDPNHVDLVQYGSIFEPSWKHYYGGQEGYEWLDNPWEGVSKHIQVSRGGSVLKVMEKMHCMGGTETHKAIKDNLEVGKGGHDRVILITDEQAWASRYGSLPVPANVPVYIWNLGGYRSAVEDTGHHNRHAFGGLSDTSFRLIPILESNHNTGWPWETKSG